MIRVLAFWGALWAYGVGSGVCFECMERRSESGLCIPWNDRPSAQSLHTTLKKWYTGLRVDAEIGVEGFGLRLKRAQPARGAITPDYTKKWLIGIDRSLRLDNA